MFVCLLLLVRCPIVCEPTASCPSPAPYLALARPHTLSSPSSPAFSPVSLIADLPTPARSAGNPSHLPFIQVPGPVTRTPCADCGRRPCLSRLVSSFLFHSPALATTSTQLTSEASTDQQHPARSRLFTARARHSTATSPAPSRSAPRQIDQPCRKLQMTMRKGSLLSRQPPEQTSLQTRSPAQRSRPRYNHHRFLLLSRSRPARSTRRASLQRRKRPGPAPSHQRTPTRPKSQRPKPQRLPPPPAPLPVYRRRRHPRQLPLLRWTRPTAPRQHLRTGR